MAKFISEDDLVASRRGKWSQAGVPHKGWQCIEIEDLGSPDLTCEMCESREIRYVHHMQHDSYADVIKAGCVCAGHMEGDLLASREREAGMKSRSARRKRWTTRQWKISRNGNPNIVADGYRVTVYPRGGAWACTIAALDDTDVRHSRRNYPTQDAAKLAGFDQITRMLSAGR